MKTTIASAALAGFIASAQAQFVDRYFDLMSVLPGSPIDSQNIEAAGQHLWIGGGSAHYCPSSVDASNGCPHTTFTNFASNKYTYGELLMGANVPGGQTVYIDATCGALRYTQAHSAVMPNDAILVKWTLTQPAGASYQTLNWAGQGGSALGHEGLLACNGTEGGEGRYGIYANIGITPPGHCLGFEAVTTRISGSPAAWQYI
ncbi:hypothetical protein LTR08_000706 [Meristemomyces frigidus]|nr:hypothetical protein LTR08_000706 [Meristemomyces frigidus]